VDVICVRDTMLSAKWLYILHSNNRVHLSVSWRLRVISARAQWGSVAS